MPDLENMTKYLKVGNLKLGEVLTFKDNGVIHDKDFSRTKDGSDVKRVFEITVELNNGSEKTLTMNKGSIKSLSDVWGGNSDDWVGKQCRVTFGPKGVLLVPVENV